MASVAYTNVTRMRTWQDAIEWFIDLRGFSPQTGRVYGSTLRLVGDALPVWRLESLTPEAVREAAIVSYGKSAPATWNRTVATLRAFLRFTAREGWTGPDLARLLDTCRVPVDNGRVLDRAFVDRLLARRDVPIRDRALWRMLLDTAARANEVLRLNVEDLN